MAAVLGLGRDGCASFLERLHRTVGTDCRYGGIAAAPAYVPVRGVVRINIHGQGIRLIYRHCARRRTDLDTGHGHADGN